MLCALVAIAAAYAVAPPKAGPAGTGLSLQGHSLSATRSDVCQRDQTPFGSSISVDDICPVAATRAKEQDAELASRSSLDPAFTLAVTTHKIGESIRHSAATWYAAGLLRHKSLREVVLHINRCTCRDVDAAHTLFDPLVPHLSPSSFKVVCSSVNRVQPQVMVSVMTEATQPFVLWVEGDRPMPRRYKETADETVARVESVVDAALKTAHITHTPMVYLHRRGLSHMDDRAFASWLAARSKGDDPQPPEDALPAGAGAGDLSRCSRWCLDFTLAAGAAVDVDPAGAPPKQGLESLCQRVVDGGDLSELANRSITIDADGKELSCGRAPGDDCSCLFLVCKQWKQWTSGSEKRPDVDELPLCLRTWMRQSPGAAPKWFKDGALVTNLWDAPTSPHVLCAKGRGQWWEAAPFVARTAWWLHTVAGAMCGSSTARVNSGIQISPQRHVWTSYGKAMESWLGRSLQREQGVVTCWADGVTDHTELDAPPDGRVVVDGRSMKAWAEAEAQAAREVVVGDKSSEDKSRSMFPVGTYVEVSGLSSSELNGQRGTVSGYVGPRVVIVFHGRGGKRAVLPTQLKNSSLPPVARVRFGCGVSDLSLPDEAVLVGRTYCKRGGVVPRLSQCSVSAPDAHCDGVECLPTGRWNVSRPACRYLRCSLEDLALPLDAKACYGPPTGKVSAGATCAISTPSAVCPSVECLLVPGRGARWNTSKVDCSPCGRDKDTLYTGGEVPIPSRMKNAPQSVCACRETCGGIGTGAFSFIPANVNRTESKCVCLVRPSAAQWAPGVVSGTTGRQATKDAEEAAEDASATGCGRGASRQAAAAWGDVGVALGNSVRKLGVGDVGVAKACAAAHRRWRSGHVTALRSASQRSFAPLTAGAAPAEICVEDFPDVDRKVRRWTAVARAASDAVAPGQRRVVVFAGAKGFARKASDGGWRLGHVAEFVCGYPGGASFEIAAFEEDEAKYGDTAPGAYLPYPEGMPVVWARTAARGGAGGRLLDLAAWLRDHVSPKDFVVLVMDIGGAEHEILPYLAAKGALQLVDEAFVRCANPPDAPAAKLGPGERPEECKHLRQDVMSNKVVWHDW
eukprot:TRINITY_DN1674_c0_g1_i1.p1 TRINITY_DN1674_c0_g1~~TRINITY_DN1674_c0_g1_i1.p1  ORF type:complete len:1222 (+),score=297.37 TRINITY_DN1674_c0_g1_i1:423-3668(+)